MLDSLDFLQSPRLQALKSQADASANEADKRQFLVMLVKEIINAINETTVAKIEGGVDINNLDTITAALHNELARANKPITDILKQLKLTTQEQTSVIQQIEKKAIDDFNAQYQTVIVKRVRDQVEVSNLSDLAFPAQVGINNLNDLATYFKDLSDKIEALDLVVNLPAPQVVVTPTPITIPEVHIPSVDFNPIVKALDSGLNRLRTNSETRPLAVRLSDGQAWIKELRIIAEQQKQTVQYMSDSGRLRDAAGNPINPATADGQGGPKSIGDGSQTVTTAGTRVQLIVASTPCRYVYVTGLPTNTDLIWLGGVTVAAGRGVPLIASQFQRFEINDVSKLNMDSVVNGEGCAFAFVT